MPWPFNHSNPLEREKMTVIQLPSPELLRKLLRYNYDTGKLFWRERTPDVFKDGKQSAEWICSRWNSTFANNETFTAVSKNGYLTGEILGKKLLSHRVIWAIVTGFWPVDQIDHEDHDRQNNKFGNLFEATRQENMKNQSMSKLNTSGHVGVVWNKEKSKWQAQIGVNRKIINLGRFLDIEDAIDARQAANIKYGFHRHHGKKYIFKNLMWSFCNE